LNKNKYRVTTLCKVLNITRQNYYKYRNKVDKDYYDYLEIKRIFEEGRRLYGARRLKKALAEKTGWIVNLKKIRRIMKKYDLKVRYKDVYKTNYQKKRIEQNVKPNLLKRNFKATKVNQKWSTDITYIIHNGKRAYLSSIMDLYTRDIIAYKIDFKMDNKLVIDTLNEAITKQKDVTGVIIHSDQGFQYTSYEYKAICEANEIHISMSPKGSPVDNSPIESFHSNLKRETLHSYDITSLEHYIDIVKDWLLFYNTNRVRL
jgi:Transposase and inactivated derivatives